MERQQARWDGQEVDWGVHKGVWLDRHVGLMAKDRIQQEKVTVEVGFCSDFFILFYLKKNLKLPGKCEEFSCGSGCQKDFRGGSCTGK